MSVPTLDAMAWICARPDQFFGVEHPDAMHLLASLMADVLLLGGGECVMRRSEQWWIVGSDMDWMREQATDLAGLFNRVVAVPCAAIERTAGFARAVVFRLG